MTTTFFVHSFIRGVAGGRFLLRLLDGFDVNVPERIFPQSRSAKLSSPEDLEEPGVVELKIELISASIAASPFQEGKYAHICNTLLQNNVAFCLHGHIYICSSKHAAFTYLSGFYLAGPGQYDHQLL